MGVCQIVESKREATAELKRAVIGTQQTLLSVWGWEWHVVLWMSSAECRAGSVLCHLHLCAFSFIFCPCIHLWDRTEDQILDEEEIKWKLSVLQFCYLKHSKYCRCGLTVTEIVCRANRFPHFGPLMEYQFWLRFDLERLSTLDPNMLDTNHCLHIDTSSFEDQPIRNEEDKLSLSLDCDRHAYHSLKEGGHGCFYAFIEYK